MTLASESQRGDIGPPIRNATPSGDAAPLGLGVARDAHVYKGAGPPGLGVARAVSIQPAISAARCVLAA